ncbi:beta-ketoacyl synthase N-terminal-like domain-containing protein [Xanthomarina sp. F2636L]|uniref:beta-ketoacyl synthase N-terminal-like domain-containing protein n=1 Tax=Xanthomarina sp. F2636L TaxID=2996018 RepID=UPI00225E05EA|nr:beta-ketoacyl synthase N-terminal-like domain-containing protein [Xanthomarina sp. F2636L]MCX7551457.1 beta-ketoacyl synthase N-terminal-like domain-containing protein [Xanthomarina sp. F2636L]
MKKVYINSISSITAQKTFDNSEFLDKLIIHENQVVFAVEPNYKDYIPPAAARRMAKGIKMGVVASKMALQEANLEQVDAIITGTGMGCLRDSEKFLSAIIDNNEQFLTPTSFIQSTHNTVGGQVALELQCKGYNFTYVHGSNSFESGLLDAKMQLELDEAQNILVGGVDELGDHTTKLNKIIHHIKDEKISSMEILNSKTKGTVFGEGANFFVLSNKKQAFSYAEILSVKLFNTLDHTELNEIALSFLNDNHLSVEDIDTVVLGNNGDVEFDSHYYQLTSGIFKNTQQVCYKHLIGEFNTASPFGLWVASKILKNQTVPGALKKNDLATSSFKYILLYNMYRGENHSFILLKSC